MALGLLARAPERFGRAILISAHPGLEDAELRAERRSRDAAWADRLRREGIAAFVRDWESQPLFATQAGVPRERLERQRARRLAQDPRGLAASLDHHGLGRMPSLWPALERFSGQIDWVVGAADTKFLAIGQAVTRRRPSTRLRVLPGIGHNPLLECPEWVMDVLKE